MRFYLSKSTIAMVTVTCEIGRCASSIISKRHTWDVLPLLVKFLTLLRILHTLQGVDG